MRPLALAALLVALPLAGCLGAPAPAGGPPPAAAARFEDPRGDAVEQGEAFLADAAWRNCLALGLTLGSVCRAALDAERERTREDPGPGREAPPGLDLLAIALVERADVIEVRFEVAGLEEGFAGLLGEETFRAEGASWGLCWAGGAHCAGAAAHRYNGVLATNGWYEPRMDLCGWEWCGMALPVAFEFGAPGAVRFDLPRAALPGGGHAGEGLAAPLALALRTERVGAAVDAFAWGPGAFEQLRTPRRHFYLADGAGPGDDFVLRGPRAPLALDGPLPVRALPAGDVTRADLWGPWPELDVLEQRLAETPGALHVATLVAEVPEAPRDHRFFVWLSVAGRGAMVGGYEAREGAVAPWGVSCPDRACADGDLEALEVDLARATGAPGWVNLTVPRAALGDPARGDLVDELLVRFLARPHQAGQARGGAGAAVVGDALDDWNRLYPAAWLRLDPPPRVR